MPYIDTINVGTTAYEIHDARITGSPFRIAAVMTQADATAAGIVDGQEVSKTGDTYDYSEGDVIIITPSGKEFVAVTVQETGAYSQPIEKLR